MCFTVLMGGVCLIANTASMMCKSIFKIYLNQKKSESYGQLKDTAHTIAQKGYFENNVKTHLHSGCMHLRKRKVPSSMANNSTEASHEPGAGYEGVNHHHTSAQTLKPNRFDDMFLIYLLLLCCMLENFGTVLLGLHSQADAILPSCCNTSISPGDCFLFSRGIVLHKQYLPSFLCTVALCALTTFPVSVILTKHCYSHWPHCLLSSVIFVISIVVSRCFAFFLLPCLLRDKAYNFIIER